MSYGSDAVTARRHSTLGFAPGRPDEDSGHTRRDSKKLILIVGLGILSWVATYVGMLELIEANMGDLPLMHRGIIGFSVAMLMVMVVWLLDQMFAPIPAFTKFCYAIGYVFLTIISVGFGFGFYWKVLESRSESSRSAESAVSQVQAAMYGAATRLDQLQGTLVRLSEVSTEKAELERTKGTSCPNSRPGDGPRRKMRDDDAARFSFASDFVKSRAGAVKGELTALDADLARIASSDPATFDAKTGTRNEFMKALSRKLDMTVTGFNAFRSDPQLRQLRTELADRAERSTFGDPKKGGFVCPDAQLQGALRGAVKAIDELPDLEKPKIAAVEGSEATIEAFRRLTATFYGMLAFKLPPSADELRELQQKAVQSVEDGGATLRRMQEEQVGLSKRDYIPLAVALFVDLCLLLVSMGRPVNRLGGLLPKMREAERSPVSQILSRFNDIHRDPNVRQTFEVFRHVVFDQGGVYYVAVPLDAPYSYNPRDPHQKFGYGSAEAQELQHEAHLLANLFTSFEKERIFARVYSPLLTTGSIQKKLARQGSKFAGCGAFRLYRFRDGAWPEIILGAVMGAARRAEEADRQRLMETAADITLPDTTRPAERAEPRAARVSPPPSRTRGRSPATANARDLSDDLNDAVYDVKHGPYARAAKADLSVHPEPSIEVQAANSNTGPGRGAVSDPARGEPASPTVVPLRPRPAAPQPQPGTRAHAAGADEDTVDVVMRRETATFTIPVSHATLPRTLVSGVHSSAAAQATLDLSEPIAEIARALERSPLDATWEDTSTDDESQPELDFDTEDADGVAAIAGRLRPALPGQ